MTVLSPKRKLNRCLFQTTGSFKFQPSLHATPPLPPNGLPDKGDWPPIGGWGVGEEMTGISD